MIPYGDERCENCAKMAQVDGKCYCTCHTTNYMRSKHNFVYEQPLKKNHFLIRWWNRLKGEKFATI